MTTLLQSYSGPPRIAVVSIDELPDNPIAEHMCIGEDRVCFSSDGFTVRLDTEKLRSTLRNGDIVTISSDGVIFRVYENEDHNATVFLTGQCNSNCIMCPCSDHERQYNIGFSDEWMRSYLNMLPFDVGTIIVTGGEPTLKTLQFFSVMELLADRFPRTDTLLLTNGRSFAAKSMVSRLLNHCPPLMMAGIPLHGSSAALHDAITRTPGSFQQTCMGIQNLLENDVAVEIRVVVSKLNLNQLDMLSDLICHSFPAVRIVTFMGLETLGNCAKYLDQVYVSPSDSWDFVRSAIMCLMTHGIAAQIYNYPLCAVDRGFWPLCRQSITPYKVRFPEACSVCDAKSQCGGFFSSTLGVVKPKVKPIHF